MLEILNFDSLIEITLICLIVLGGAIAKDYLRIMKCGEGSIAIARVLLSTLTASLLIFAFSTYIQTYVGPKGLMLASFIGGLTGFEILERSSTIDGLVSMRRIIGGLISPREDIKTPRRRTREPKERDD